MRAALSVVMATLILGLGHGPALAQTDGGWLYSIHMFDALTGWAVDAEGYGGVVAKGAVESVVRTTDGGLHWKDVTPHAPPGQTLALGQGDAIEVDWLNSLVVWVAAPLDNPTHDTLLFHTVDGGRTLKSVTPPSVGTFDFLNARDGWLLAGNDMFRSTDGGETWIKIASANFTGQSPTITFLNTKTGWVNPWRTYAPAWALYVTHDGGYTWQQQTLPRPAQLKPQWADTLPLIFFTARDGVLPASTSQLRFVLYVTHDEGTTWTYTTPVSVAQWGPHSLADMNHGWVTDGGVLHVTSDGGRHWTTIRPGPPFGGVSQLDFISPQIGWAAGQPLNLSFLLKTKDGGHTWAPVAYTISRP